MKTGRKWDRIKYINSLIAQSVTALSKHSVLSLSSRVTWLLYFLLVLQLVAGFYHAMTLPLHYDEWFSWRFFSGKTFSVILGEYPAPNNHIFYNFCARFFLLLGLPPETGVRMPAVFSSVLALFLFFVLCRRYFSDELSLLLSAILMSNYSFAAFAASARGYAFVFLFCITLILAVVMLHENYRDRRARILLILSVFLGLWTVPSFIYVMVVPCFLLMLSLLIQKAWRAAALFILDGMVSGLLVLAAYSGILFFGDPYVFLHPEAWTETFVIDDNWFRNVVKYTHDLFSELFSLTTLIVAFAASLIVTLIVWLRGTTADRFMILVCVLIFIMPPFVLLVHKVYPFSRSLSFIVVVGVLLLGFLLREAGKVELFRNWGLRIGKLVVSVASVAVAVTGLISVHERHARAHGWEHNLEALRHGVLEGKMDELRSVARTNAGMEFYAAEILLFMAATESPDATYELRTLEELSGEHVLVIHESELSRFGEDLSGYKKVLALSGIHIYVLEAFLSDYEG